jgi:transposase-like protein
VELFKNADEALIFAFRFSAQQYAMSPHAKMMKTGIVGSGKGLVSLDGAGQAGLIRGEIEKMPSFKRSCIIARYSLRYEDCPCCGSDKMVDEYKEAVANLAEWSTQWITGMSVRTMRHAIIRAYYERGVSIREIAERINVPKSTAYDQKNAIWAKLKQLDCDAQREAADRLEKMCGFLETA